MMAAGLSDASLDRALDDALDRVPSPVVPVGLVARIVREVPLQAQFTEGSVEGRDMLRAQGAVPGARNRRLWATGAAFGALAAGIALVITLGMQPSSIVPRDGGTSLVRAVPPQPLAAPGGQVSVVPPARLVAAPSAPRSGVLPSGDDADDEPTIQPSAGPSVLPAPSAAPEQFAATQPSGTGEMVGPADDDGTPGTQAMPSRPLMGPPAPQAYGYVGAMPSTGGGASSVPGAPGNPEPAPPPPGRLPGRPGGGVHPYR